MKALLITSLLINLVVLTEGIRADPAFSEPLWWHEGDLPIIDENVITDDKGIANVGQLKWVAKSALQEIAKNRSDIAIKIQSDLIGEGKPLPSLEAPEIPTSDWLDVQKAPLAIGQLKAVAAIFYRSLHDEVPEWLLAQRKLNGNIPSSVDLNSEGEYPAPHNKYPWTLSDDDDSNYSPATIGQLKILFCLRFDSLPSVSDDSDEDGLLDAWEMAHFGNLLQLSGGDPDQDGISNLAEYIADSNPKDYYNGRIHSIQVIDGDLQSLTFLENVSEALIYKIVDENGNPLVNAPATFDISQGSGTLSLYSNGSSNKAILENIRTNNQGLITIYFVRPSQGGPS